MSGIYGTLRQYSDENASRKIAQLKHRGPVQVLDMQPNTPAAVLDGSFYNQSADVLLELYSRYGVDCLHQINGDFAFVIYDPNGQRLFGAVDRVGSKPLYYSLENGFEFCSHLLPLCIGNSYSIDPYARQCYFAMQYVPAPNSIVKEVHKMAAGEYFIYNLADGSFSTHSYWDLYANTQQRQAPKSFDEAVKVCEELIADAVEKRMGGEPQYALFLSGGIDSSLVSAYARRYADCKAYSVSFNESNWDESSYSSQVAKHLDIPCERLLFSFRDATNILSNLQNYYDEPIGDASMLPTSFLCEQVGRQAPRALCGDGGDEVFFGYPRYLRYAKRQKVYNIPGIFRKTAAGLLDLCGKKREALSLRLDDVQTLYLNRRKYNPAELFDALSIQQSIPQCKYLYQNKEAMRAFNDFDIKTVLPYELCVKMDRASVRGNIATQAPLLDYRLLEYSRIIPSEILYKPEIGQKSILREILYREVPQELFMRHKRGFGVPINAWFRDGLKEYLVDTLNADTAQLLPEYDSAKLLQMRDSHINATADYAPFLWMVVNYIEWHRLFRKMTEGQGR